MLCTTAFKRILNIFVPNQIDRTRTNTGASTSCFQNLPIGEQEKDNLGACLREVQVQAPKVQVISATKVGEEHCSYLKSHDAMDSSSSPSNFDYHDMYSDKTSELDDYDNEEDAEDEPSFAATNPIVFSEDPMTRSKEMLEFANDLVDIAMTNINESEEIMNVSQLEDLSRWKERLDRMSEILEILETDTPAVRLLKARAYLMAAGELLKRVIFVVELAKSTQLGNSD